MKIKSKIQNPKSKIQKIILLLVFTFINIPLLHAQDTIETFPSAPFDRFIIYQTLAIFWLGIIGLIVIIKMKLREIERTRKMGIDREEKDIPLLD